MRNKPDVVIFAAAKVGDIHANETRPATFIYENLVLELNVVHGAHVFGVDRLVCLGSSCIYRKIAAQPIREDSLLTGPLESTNEWYAIAKIAGVKPFQAYQRQQPLWAFDNFDQMSSHLLPPLMRNFHDSMICAGTPMRELLHVDDLTARVVFCLGLYDGSEPRNCRAGLELSIQELAAMVQQAVGFNGDITFDSTKPVGTPRKLMASGRLLELGWRPTIAREDGIPSTFEWFLENLMARSAVA